MTGPTSVLLSPREAHLIASFFARPEFVTVRPLLEALVPGSTERIDEVVRKVRAEQWRDLS